MGSVFAPETAFMHNVFADLLWVTFTILLWANIPVQKHWLALCKTLLKADHIVSIVKFVLNMSDESIGRLYYPLVVEQEVKVIWQKAPHEGPFPG